MQKEEVHIGVGAKGVKLFDNRMRLVDNYEWYVIAMQLCDVS